MKNECVRTTRRPNIMELRRSLFVTTGHSWLLYATFTDSDARCREMPDDIPSVELWRYRDQRYEEWHTLEQDSEWVKSWVGI